MLQNFKYKDIEIKASASAYVLISYKNNFNSDFFNDLRELSDKKGEIDVTILSQVLYCCAVAAGEKKDFAAFMEQFDIGFFTDKDFWEGFIKFLTKFVESSKDKKQGDPEKK